MVRNPREAESYHSQLRLLLEELCCDLCWVHQVKQHGVAPEEVRVDREFYLGVPDTFADIRVAVLGQPLYFVEVKYGYSNHALLQLLRRKYGRENPHIPQNAKVVLVIDAERRPDWDKLEPQLHLCLRPDLLLEIWNEAQLLAQFQEQFGVAIEAITEDTLLDIHHDIEQAKGRSAFGTAAPGDYDHDVLKAELLWHFGVSRLQQLCERDQRTPRQIMPPGLYRGVAILLADLCSFSSYVRDTPDDEVIRHCLTTFYSKARYQIINHGGMLYQFVGDEVVALFGVPDQQPGFVQNALEAARELLTIGISVSNHWQRKIDRVQNSRGLHIGMAVGDLQIVALRPFSRTHMGAVGDSINLAARLMAVAGPGEIVVSNAFQSELDEETQALFQEVAPVEAKNVGVIKAWKLSGGQGL